MTGGCMELLCFQQFLFLFKIKEIYIHGRVKIFNGLIVSIQLKAHHRENMGD